MQTDPKTIPANQTNPVARPRRKALRWLIFALVPLAAITALAVWVSSLAEPEYKGVKLSVWLERYNNEVDAEPQRNEAEEAIQQIGSNAVPTLIRWLSVSDSKLRTKLMERAREQPFIKFNYTDPDEYHNRALEVFKLLGSEGKSTIPKLQKMLQQTNTREYALLALCLIGSDASPILVSCLTNDNVEIRQATGGAIRASYSSLAPAYVWPGAVDLNLSVPLLSRLLQDSNEDIRVAVMMQLGRRVQTNMQPGLVIPLLICELKRKDGDDCWAAAGALGRFGSQAALAVPTLKLAVAERDESTSAAAYDALIKIDPEAAAKAVAK